jgi:two-component system, OmpR family, KDP operon response regulator KdpE
MSGNERILVVDDEPQIRRVIQTLLVSNGYQVWDARTGDEALELVHTEKFDLAILDINLPDKTGIDVCRQIRAGYNLGIVMLTVRTGEMDKIAAFNAGADDYVTKPFDAPELLARVRANLRRHRPSPGIDLFVCDDFVINFAERTVNRQEKKERLTLKQYQLLRFLVSSRGKPQSHRDLLRAIWGPDYSHETMLLRALIAQLRKKIEPDPSHPRYIVTIPWVGYRFDSPTVHEQTA